VAVTIPAVPKGDPKSGQFLLKLSPEMLEAIKDLAARERRSATGQIEWILERWLAENAPIKEGRRK
jgi:hypothetical protein